MSRVAGQPDKKRKYLDSLDDKQFPYLIADILYFIFNHKEIKILDGPGDGRRDITSINSENRLCITQCKFHKDFKTSIGSRETDEIAIALTKFKVKDGIFATTGKLSPQAKREFINDFPDYNLRYFEGTDVIDIVLSSPILTSVWINNQAIEPISKPLIIPFIVRDLENDKSISKIEDFGLNPNIKIIERNITTDYFHPFRTPANSMRESGTFIYCYHIILQENIHLHAISDLYQNITNKVATCFQSKDKLIAVRFGVPYFARIDKENEIKDSLKLDFKPKTIIVKSNLIINEQEYIIPINVPHCSFPNRFGHLEAPWAAWFFRKDNICLQIELTLPFEKQADYFTLGMRDVHLQKLDESLFFIVSKSQFEELESLLSKDNLPTWSSEYGFDGHVIGWLHPYLLDDADFRSFQMEDEKFVLNEDKKKLNLFNEKLNKVEGMLKSKGYITCPTKKAINISEFTSNPLFIEPEKKTVDSAYLYHFFEDIASPVSLKEREYDFICIWNVPSYSFDSDSVDFVNELNLHSNLEFNFFFDIKTTVKKENKYARLDLIYSVAENKSSSEFIDSVYEEIIAFKDLVEKRLKIKNPDAELQTEYFWNNEIGILFN